MHWSQSIVHYTIVTENNKLSYYEQYTGYRKIEKEENGSSLYNDDGGVLDYPDPFFKHTLINPKDDKTQLIFKTTKTIRARGGSKGNILAKNIMLFINLFTKPVPYKKVGFLKSKRAANSFHD